MVGGVPYLSFWDGGTSQPGPRAPLSLGFLCEAQGSHTSGAALAGGGPPPLAFLATVFCWPGQLLGQTHARGSAETARSQGR